MKDLKKTLLLVAFVIFSSQFNYAQVMNEIYSRGIVSEPDWIEIYNGTSTAVDISGYKIYDIGGQSGTKPKKLFPAGSSIPAYGYLFIVTDDGAADGSGFGLSSTGEKVWLENASGSIIDSVVFSAMQTTESYGRAADGGPWKLLSIITKGKTNVVLSQVILPQYIQGLNGTNNTRVPFVFRVTINNLLSSTTYKYINQIIIAANDATNSGAGNCIFVNADNSFVRTSSVGFVTPGQYGQFTTDANGSFSGWFINEPTGNARFTPGGYVYMRIRLNDGATGTTAVSWATTSDSVKVINFGTANDANQGTGIYGRSSGVAKDLVFLYDNVDGTGRPLAGTIIEKDGIDLGVLTSTAQFYRDSVDNFIGAWGTIIPNQLVNGVRRIERRLLSDGSIYPIVGLDDNGIWPSGANTVNPTGGLTPIRIDMMDAILPVDELEITATVIGNLVKLNWTTLNEKNNSGFDIERKYENLDWQKIAFVNGNGTTMEQHNYYYSDKNISAGKYLYRIKQIDFDGSINHLATLSIFVNAPDKFELLQNYPNPFNPSTTIVFNLPEAGNVKLIVYNLLGQEVQTLVNGFTESGSHKINFEAKNLNSGIYFYKLEGNGINAIRKMTLLK